MGQGWWDVPEMATSQTYAVFSTLPFNLVQLNVNL